MSVSACALFAGCGSGGGSGAGTATSVVRQAADATAKASGFTFRLPSVEVTYNAPDRVEQIEHGQASTAASGNGSPAASIGPAPATITKIIVGDRYYEANAGDGQARSFTVSQRCPRDNAADVVLEVLRAIAFDGQAEGSDGRYTFTLPAAASTSAITGTVIVDGGYVRQLSVASGTFAPAVTIEAIGAAPTVAAPLNASLGNTSCG